jgi:hypothetical protein
MRHNYILYVHCLSCLLQVTSEEVLYSLMLTVTGFPFGKDLAKVWPELLLKTLLIYLGYAARLCEEIFLCYKPTTKSFLLSLGCIKSSISQMCKQQNTEFSYSFWFLQNHCLRANECALRQKGNVHINQMLTSTIIWENNFKFLPSFCTFQLF